MMRQRPNYLVTPEFLCRITSLGTTGIIEHRIRANTAQEAREHAERFGFIVLGVHPTVEYAEEVAARELEATAPFSVIAGGYHGDEPNYKYIDSFGTLDEAIDAATTARDYSWCYIEYKGRVLEVWAPGSHPFK